MRFRGAPSGWRIGAHVADAGLSFRWAARDKFAAGNRPRRHAHPRRPAIILRRCMGIRHWELRAGGEGAGWGRLYGPLAPAAADVDRSALGGEGSLLATCTPRQAIDAPVYGYEPLAGRVPDDAYRRTTLIARLEAAEEEGHQPAAHCGTRTGVERHHPRGGSPSTRSACLRRVRRRPSLRFVDWAAADGGNWFCDGDWVARPRAPPSTTYSAPRPDPAHRRGCSWRVTAVAAFPGPGGGGGGGGAGGGALLPQDAVVRFEVIEPEKRPGDGRCRQPVGCRNVAKVEIPQRARGRTSHPLRSPGHGLEERLIPRTVSCKAIWPHWMPCEGMV